MYENENLKYIEIKNLKYPKALTGTWSEYCQWRLQLCFEMYKLKNGRKKITLLKKVLIVISAVLPLRSHITHSSQQQHSQV